MQSVVFLFVLLISGGSFQEFDNFDGLDDLWKAFVQIPKVVMKPTSITLFFVKREYLLGLDPHDRILRHEDLPPSALFKGTPDPQDVIMLSYPWQEKIDDRHPDPSGDILKTIQGFLKEFPKYKYVFWDYMCIYQDGGNQEQIRAYLAAANEFYFESDTLAIVVGDYLNRTWCVTEFIISALLPKVTTYVIGQELSLPLDAFQRLLFAIELFDGTTLTFGGDRPLITDLLKKFSFRLLDIFQTESLSTNLKYLGRLNFDGVIRSSSNVHLPADYVGLIAPLVLMAFDDSGSHVHRCPEHDTIINNAARCWICQIEDLIIHYPRAIYLLLENNPFLQHHLSSLDFDDKTKVIDVVLSTLKDHHHSPKHKELENLLHSRKENIFSDFAQIL